MFWIKNKKIRYTPANPSFSIRVGFKGVYISQTCFSDGVTVPKCLDVSINESSMNEPLIISRGVLEFLFDFDRMKPSYRSKIFTPVERAVLSFIPLLVASISCWLPTHKTTLVTARSHLISGDGNQPTRSLVGRHHCQPWEQGDWRVSRFLTKFIWQWQTIMIQWQKAIK